MRTILWDDKADPVVTGGLYLLRKRGRFLISAGLSALFEIKKHTRM